MTNCLAVLVSVLHLILEAFFHTILSRESMKQPAASGTGSGLSDIFFIHCDMPVLHCFPLHLYIRKVFITMDLKWVSIFCPDLSL